MSVGHISNVSSGQLPVSRCRRMAGAFQCIDISDPHRPTKPVAFRLTEYAVIVAQGLRYIQARSSSRKADRAIASNTINRIASSIDDHLDRDKQGRTSR